MFIDVTVTIQFTHDGRTSTVQVTPGVGLHRTIALTSLKAILVELGPLRWSRATVERILNRLSKRAPDTIVSWIDTDGGTSLSQPGDEPPKPLYGPVVYGSE